MAKKTIVEVNLDWDGQGNLTPRAIYWRDGTVFTVDRVLEMTKAPARKVGGMGDWYLVRLTNEELNIHGKTTYLFRECGERESFWFVEEKEVRHPCRDYQSKA